MLFSKRDFKRELLEMKFREIRYREFPMRSGKGLVRRTSSEMITAFLPATSSSRLLQPLKGS